MEAYALDIGHGWLKALGPGNRLLRAPALLAPAGGWAAGLEAEDPVRIDGEAWWVGEAARDRGGAPCWARDKAADPATLRLALAAVAALGGDGPVRVAVGLPLAWFAAGRQALADAWRGRTARVRWPGDPERVPVLERVDVLPQGAAAAGMLLAPAFPRGPWLLVDVGARTTDYVRVDTAEGRLRIDVAHAGSVEAGAQQVWQGIADRLSQAAGVPFLPGEVEGRDAVYVRGREWDLRPWRAEQAALLAGELRRRLEAALDAALLKVRGMLLLGGGAPILAQAWPDALLPDDPQLANVRAYAAYLQATAGGDGP